jgi:sterol desaturase/sphingolipid hydroxylase (fatty acid hydroxylase superfamily)
MSILIYAVPLYLILILIELVVDRRRNTGYYRLNDAFGSLSLGILSRSSKLVVFSLGALFIDSLLPELRLWQLSEDSAWVWLFAFVATDLTYYWSHRMAHTLNLFWAGHVIHHSSEEYNLTTALRQGSSSILGWIFSIPLLMLGVPAEMFVTCMALNLIYQFWVHTRHIDKLWPWFEWLMVTPSHHRVHHAQNAVYIDKNHGGVFIIWDRLFGTFQAELDDEEIIYGVRRPLQSFNPVWGNLQVWWSLIVDAWRTRSWWDKLRIWWMPTGWRPADVEARYPIVKSDLTAFVKYDPQVDKSIQIYGLVQLALCVGLLGYFLFFMGGLDYWLMLFGFVMISLPLVTTGYLFEGRDGKIEGYRLLFSWIGLLAALPVLSLASAWVFGVYLLLSSFYYSYVWLLAAGGQKAAPAE